MKRNILNAAAGLAAIMVLLGMVGSASAQRRESRGRMLNKAQVQDIIKRVEDRVDKFKKSYDKALDRSRLNGTDREDWLKNRAKDLEHATDDLRKHFDKTDAWIENRDEVRRCLNIASDIDRNMRKARYDAATEENWAAIRFELNSLADVYNMPRVGANAYN